MRYGFNNRNKNCSLGSEHVKKKLKRGKKIYIYKERTVTIYIYIILCINTVYQLCNPPLTSVTEKNKRARRKAPSF